MKCSNVQANIQSNPPSLRAVWSGKSQWWLSSWPCLSYSLSLISLRQAHPLVSPGEIPYRPPAKHFLFNIKQEQLKDWLLFLCGEQLF